MLIWGEWKHLKFWKLTCILLHAGQRHVKKFCTDHFLVATSLIHKRNIVGPHLIMDKAIVMKPFQGLGNILKNLCPLFLRYICIMPSTYVGGCYHCVIIHGDHSGCGYQVFHVTFVLPFMYTSWFSNTFNILVHFQNLELQCCLVKATSVFLNINCWITIWNYIQSMIVIISV